MDTLFKIIQSRTVWTIIIQFAVGGLQATQSLFPTDVYLAIQGVLSIVAVYFKVNPSQRY